MKFINVKTTDPYFNLALEQYVFDCLPRENEYFLLWQNDNAIIVGKHQNTEAEICREYVEAKKIRVVRRLSGGGAVYHDLGNLNFTFITDDGKKAFDFGRFCRPVIKALKKMGVKAELNGRNDMTIDGRKFSGNSQYFRGGRVMHHGTLMYDSDLSAVESALRVSAEKIQSKGVKSVRSRVANIRPCVAEDVDVEEFRRLLIAHLSEELPLQPFELTQQDIEQIETLARHRYRTWEWNYGNSPACTVEKSRRFEGCGNIQLRLTVKKGVIEGFDVYGDYFGNGDKRQLATALCGVALQRDAVCGALSSLDISEYFNHLTAEQFIGLLLS